MSWTKQSWLDSSYGAFVERRIFFFSFTAKLLRKINNNLQLKIYLRTWINAHWITVLLIYRLLLNFATWTQYRVKLYRSQNPSKQSLFLRKMFKSNLQVCSASFWLFKYTEKQVAFHHCLSYCKALVKIYKPNTWVKAIQLFLALIICTHLSFLFVCIFPWHC